MVGKVHTGFFSFPKTIPESAFTNDSKPEFYFSYRDTWDDGTKVINRLEYEESDRFIHPVYIAIDCDNHSYEYAMDLGNNEIAYIYTSFKDNPISLKKVPKRFKSSVVCDH